MIHQVEISRLLIDEHSPSQSIMLHEMDGRGRSITINIGSFEAMSISSILNNQPFPRPLTHTLAACIIKALEGTLERVVITDLKSISKNDNFSPMTFFAELHIRQGDRLVVMDCRPSDAMAISLALKSPIFADEKVLAKVNKSQSDGQIDQQE